MTMKKKRMILENYYLPLALMGYAFLNYLISSHVFIKH